MKRELGLMDRIDAREVWTHEARDFTPWLKKNISLLGGALQLDLDLVEAEVPVGPFAADLVAKDVSGDRWVVIENQLEATDHGHLGQLLTYGAGTGASIFVWISPEFREEHRAAVDWLNEHSDDSSLFFGVEIELITVDASRPAPNFKLVSSPNEWSKSAHTRQRTAPPLTEKGAAYQMFFGDVLAMFKSKYPRETNVSRPSTANWMNLAIGRSGFSTSWEFHRGGFHINLYIDTGLADINKSYFDQLYASKKAIEDQIEGTLDWDRLDDKRACRISYEYGEDQVTIMDGDRKLAELKEWSPDAMMRFRQVLRPHIEVLTSRSENL